MRVLAAAPDAVLWLLDPGDDDVASANLRRAASEGGVAPERLLFMPKLPHDEYLARYRHADLFLDTWPYGGHTTASDALFAGCPVLTLEGRTFAARVAGSLLRTLELPELIARDPDDYVARAGALLRQPEALAALRERLSANRLRSPLFDMDRYARDFTRAVQAMSSRARLGLAPAAFDVAP
jgi:predicted O-linked N-acetylglucosamine transferase (SPINDLY family)